jgi:hypothetical protein
MADITIEITCMESGLTSTFKYADENTFIHFNTDLNDEGMGFKVDPAKGKAEEDTAGMVVDGSLVMFNEKRNSTTSLSDLGVVDNSKITIGSDIISANC